MTNVLLNIFLYLWLIHNAMEKLSVVIITYNEEKNIKRCLDSVVPVADEIVVVDSFSTDDTEAICRKYDVRFFKQKFLPSFNKWYFIPLKYSLNRTFVNVFLIVVF